MIKKIGFRSDDLRKNIRRKWDKLKVAVPWIIAGVAVLFLFLTVLDVSPFTGLVTQDVGDNFLNISYENITLNEIQALERINDSKEIVKIMEENNFSTIYMEDVVIEAERVFQQAKYAEILRSNLSFEDKKEARDALRLVDWKDITYSDILEYTLKISDRKERAFIIFDLLHSLDKKLLELSINDLNTTRDGELLQKARTAFYEDRYEESEQLMEELLDDLEKRGLDESLLGTIKHASKSFIIRFWPYVIVFLILFVGLTYWGYRRYKFKSLVRKIDGMKREKIILEDLMKKVQVERFKDNSISKIVYDIRIRKYKDRLSEIKRRLPVLEDKLRKRDYLFD